MRTPLDHTGKVPLYRQIENHLRQNIRSDGLAAETHLPHDGVPGLSIG
ncbi:MAG: hypothetical protein KF770_17275 [Anaerolineae bacterium]|nr:hypothetical protein [Anaerolineae bacterium]